MLGTDIGAGRFKRRHHVCGCDYGRIVGHGIDLATPRPTASYALDAVQPYQGCFTHIVSSDVKDNLGGGRLGHSGCGDHQAGAGQQHEYRDHLNRFHGYPFSAGLFEQFHIFAVAFLLQVFLGDEAQGGGVDTVAQAGGGRTVVE